MRRPLLIACLLTYSIATSGCNRAGNVRPVVCPQLPPPPPSLMQAPQTEQQVRAELFAPLPPVTRK